MSREVRLLRRVTAGAGGWAGDVPWSTGTPPVAAGAPHVEVGEPIFAIPITVRENQALLSRGVVGMVRVTGADATRRFTARLYIEWLRKEAGQADVVDWRIPKGHAGTEVGDGEDFTTDPMDLRDARIAINLVPIGGSLAAGSVVELWVSEV